MKKLYFAISGAIILTIIYLVACLFFIIRKRKQPICSKTPILIIMSLIGNWFSVTLNIFNIFFQSNNDNAQGDLLNRIASIEMILFHPLFFFPYLLRGIREIRIFYISDPTPNLMGSTTTEIMHSIDEKNKIKERYYTTLLLFVLIPFIGMGLSFLNADIYNQFKLSIAVMTNAAEAFPQLVINMLLYFVENMLFLYLIYEMSMRCELIIVFFCFAPAGMILNFLEIIFEKVHPLFYLVLLIRNLGCLIVSAIIPIFKSFHTEGQPFVEVVNNAKSLEKILRSPLGFIYFDAFLKRNSPEEGLIILRLYAKIDLYKEKFRIYVTQPNEANKVAIEDGAVEIKNDYASLVNKNKANLEVLEQIEASFNNVLPQTIGMFEPIVNQIYPQLKQYYYNFRQSSSYVKLKELLKRNQIIHRNFRDGSLI